MYIELEPDLQKLVPVFHYWLNFRVHFQRLTTLVSAALLISNLNDDYEFPVTDYADNLYYFSALDCDCDCDCGYGYGYGYGCDYDCDYDSDCDCDYGCDCACDYDLGCGFGCDFCCDFGHDFDSGYNFVPITIKLVIKSLILK
ncbi:uncharacterized protein VTP21DRAFT_3053 [Calcarisporiella thermophila]|uniref:uncharacterized protein n=1 Tax=Calcarisporiella thermophila TaxID=911321 RepID=UPI003743AEC8